jgi:hypothetical protein
MSSPLFRLPLFIALAFVGLFLGGCSAGDPITKENFRKFGPGTPRTEVEAVLGKGSPTQGPMGQIGEFKMVKYGTDTKFIWIGYDFQDRVGVSYAKGL